MGKNDIDEGELGEEIYHLDFTDEVSFNIFVKTPSWGTRTIPVKGTYSINLASRTLRKKLISTCPGAGEEISVEQARYMHFKGEQLEGSLTHNDYNIQKDDIMRMIFVDMDGGAKRARAFRGEQMIFMVINIIIDSIMNFIIQRGFVSSGQANRRDPQQAEQGRHPPSVELRHQRQDCCAPGFGSLSHPRPLHQQHHQHRQQRQHQERASRNGHHDFCRAEQDHLHHSGETLSSNTSRSVRPSSAICTSRWASRRRTCRSPKSC